MNDLIKALSSYQLWLIVGLIVIILIGIGAAYIMLRQPSTTISTTTTTTTTTSQQSSTQINFLVFTQKGIGEVISPFSTTPFQGFLHVINISTSQPQQVYWWVEYPYGEMATSHYYFIPINNGTVYVVDPTTLKIVKEFTFGNSIGFIGVAFSPNQQLVAIADGPRGVVALINVTNLQIIWSQKFVSPTGRTYYPCDVRWSPDGSYLIVPMRFNNSVDLISLNGSVSKVLPASIGSQPYMVSPNMQGNMLAVEYVGNNSVGFYSLPSLKFLGILQLNVTPQRGVFTPDGKYYLEAPANANQVFVISTSNFQVVKIINLPTFSVSGLADIGVLPGNNYAYVVMHGNVNSGGIIVLISLSNLEVTTYVPLTTAPAFVIPIQNNEASYLVNNVLLPPVSGLHC
ncbi:MAG: YncE family protein [Sulfolobaceae archaeon]